MNENEFETRFKNLVFEDCLVKLKNAHDEDMLTIKVLTEQNEELKSEHYKDEEIQRLQQKIESMEKDLNRGFPISEEGQKKIDEWFVQHLKQKHDSNRHIDYIYKFVKTHLGIYGSVKCNRCGEIFTFQMMVRSELPYT